ncbi:MAG: hypothetical protein OEM02_07325, partial [Desulfobulbaceae bacterium]|nr:hypothetical protein [Desulfobulbaceae bacterium]
CGVKIKHTLQPNPSWMAKEINLPNHVIQRIISPYMVLIPGASMGHAEKRWPHYDQLASWLKKHSFQAYTVPGPNEMELCRSFKHAEMLTDGERFLNFFELATILKDARFIIGNDTGPTHLGAHLGVPGLALFSGHLPAELTGIQHSKFSHMENIDLRQLSLERITRHIRETLPDNDPCPKSFS